MRKSDQFQNSLTPGLNFLYAEEIDISFSANILSKSKRQTYVPIKVALYLFLGDTSRTGGQI